MIAYKSKGLKEEDEAQDNLNVSKLKVLKSKTVEDGNNCNMAAEDWTDTRDNDLQNKMQ